MKKDELISFIKNKVKTIRKELNLKNTDFDIVDVDIHDDILTIYTKNRSDKSIIIGPGGWVVGKLKEEIGFKVIRVEDFTDKIIFLERVKVIKEFNNDVLNDICNYFLYSVKSKREVYQLIQCQYDIYAYEILSKIFKVKPISYHHSALLPKKYEEKIKKFVKDIKFINIEIDIKRVIKNYPCGFLKEFIKKDFDNYVFTTCSNTDLKNKIINFFELFPIKIKRDEKYLNYCPLAIQSFKYHRKEFISKITLEVYKGFKEPTEAAEEILKMVKG
ncbi:hypothetical protein J422_04533 [Methanocaldococcus villosus KIN24-T80]|uniref:Uncharacterized protein n=1 Tax=Methanocaldococcus villosus KIN24-T80 TaxID=1069083 RepID=N6UUT3_9EURY|nr:hypothetical protein [Methanocaldococcus villosus]ENN96104.1 hypothetical protein J422_04533 [Methanocaldococcus villosus KIN24-T80]